MSYLTLLILFAVATQGSFSECNTLPELEAILYEGVDNIKQLSEAFFPSNDRSSRYLEVEYVFQGNETVSDCTVTYYWSVGGFLLIQPPQVFKFTSLFFNFDSNNLQKITLNLPFECQHIVYNPSTGNCSCKAEGNTILDVLTHHLFQYSKYTNYEQVIRDETSAVRSVCKQELDQYNSNEVIAFLTLIVIMPFGAIASVSFFLQKSHKIIQKHLFKDKNHHNLAGLVITGFYITIYILIMDMCAVHFVESHHNEYNGTSLDSTFNVTVTYVTLCFDLMLVLCSFGICFLYFIRVYKLYEGKYICECFSSIFLCLMVGLKKWKKLWNGDDKNKENKENNRNMWILLSSMYAPICCISSHIGYISVAWLTEPNKTTATALSAFTIHVFFFLGSRKLYKIVNNCCCSKKNDEKQPLLEQAKCTTNKPQNGSKNFNVLAFLCVLLSSSLLLIPIAFIIVTFFFLPIPTYELANYLQNIMQVFLVLIASLIYYKVFSLNESNAERFLKNLNGSYEKKTPIPSDTDSSDDTEYEDHFEKTGGIIGQVLTTVQNKNNED